MGCAEPRLPPTKVLYVSPEIPATIQQCAGAPAVPSGEYTQKDVALYLTDLEEARQDCKVKHGLILDLLEEEKDGK